MKWTALIVIASILYPAGLLYAEGECGDNGLSCGEEERCCEHAIAMFSVDHAVGPTFIDGKCIPKEQKCEVFSCGNRLCQSGFFSNPTVCCINTPEGGSPQYMCARSELSCPGNTEKLTIRESQPTRTLRRG